MFSKQYNIIKYNLKLYFLIKDWQKVKKKSLKSDFSFKFYPACKVWRSQWYKSSSQESCQQFIDTLGPKIGG